SQSQDRFHLQATTVREAGRRAHHRAGAPVECARFTGSAEADAAGCEDRQRLSFSPRAIRCRNFALLQAALLPAPVLAAARATGCPVADSPEQAMALPRVSAAPRGTA